MKPLIWIIILTAGLSLPGTICLRAQQPGPAAAKPAADQAKALDERAPQALEAKAKSLDERREAEEQDEKATQESDTVTAPATPAPRGKHWTAGGFGRVGVGPVATPFPQNRLQPIIAHG